MNMFIVAKTPVSLNNSKDDIKTCGEGTNYDGGLLALNSDSNGGAHRCLNEG